MADDHRPVSATPTLNNEDINNTTIQHESKKMNAESASLDTTTTTMERNHDIEKEHEKETGRTFNHDTEDEKEDPHDATAGQADLTRTTSTVHYVEGMKLYVLMASMTLIFFLVMIDITIVSTVSLIYRTLNFSTRDEANKESRLYHRLRVISIPWRMWVGTVLRISWLGMFYPTPQT